MPVHLQEVARQGFALEQVAHLGLDALVAAGDRGDGGGGGDGDKQRVAQAVFADALAQEVPALGVLGRDAPGVELQFAVGGAGLVEVRVAAAFLRQLAAGFQRVEIHLLGDARRQRAGLRRVERQPQAEEHILQAHHAQAHRPPAQVAAARGLDRVEVQVDHAVELAHGQAHGFGQLVEVEAVLAQVLAEVDRAQVAHRRLVVRGDFQDLGAQVRQVDDVARLGRLVAGAVALVLEGHPAVARLGQGAHHLAVELAGADGLHRAAAGFGLLVRGVEGHAVQVGQLRQGVRVEQRPVAVGLHPPHEQVGDPVGQVEVVRAARVVAGVVAQLQELLDVGVPGLEVDAGGAAPLSTLIDCCN